MDDQEQFDMAQNQQQVMMNEASNDDDFVLPPEEFNPDDQGQIDMGLTRLPSVRNKQYEMTDLLSMILQEAGDISLETAMGLDWSLILYYICGWSREIEKKLFFSTDPKTGESTYEHKTKIHYTDKYISNQGVVGKGECEVCAESDTNILRNICGHEYCFRCWEGHMYSRLNEYYREPFPPCMNGECPIKMSYTLCKLISVQNKELQAKLVEVLCRSYASLSKYVKMCKGKEGTTCQKCFTNEILYDFIECNTCGSFVCPRCGEQNHGSTQCYELRNWRELSENSQDFVQHFGIKICPTCKEGVYKYTGCNYIKCKCSEQFCYVCQIKWYPIHSDHFNCPRQKQIDKLNEQKKKIKENSEAYFQKMQETLDKLTSIARQIARISKLKKNTQFIDVLLKNFNFVRSKLNQLLQIGTAIQKALCVLWGHTLGLHFESENYKQLNCKILRMKIDSVYDFIFKDVEQMYIALNKTNINEISKKQALMITEESKAKFYQDFFKKQKQMKDILIEIKKIAEKLEERELKI